MLLALDENFVEQMNVCEESLAHEIKWCPRQVSLGKDLITMGSTCLVSHQFIVMAGGTLSLPIPLGTCYFPNWPQSENYRVPVLCSFFQSGMGTLRELVLLLETPGEAGSALQLSIWSLLSPWLLLEPSGLPGSLPERASSRRRWEGNGSQLPQGMHSLKCTGPLNICNKMFKL